MDREPASEITGLDFVEYLSSQSIVLFNRGKGVIFTSSVVVSSVSIGFTGGCSSILTSSAGISGLPPIDWGFVHPLVCARWKMEEIVKLPYFNDLQTLIVSFSLYLSEVCDHLSQMSKPSWL